jgi:hypothetical protein
MRAEVHGTILLGTNIFSVIDVSAGRLPITSRSLMIIFSDTTNILGMGPVSELNYFSLLFPTFTSVSGFDTGSEINILMPYMLN